MGDWPQAGKVGDQSADARSASATEQSQDLAAEFSQFEPKLLAAARLLLGHEEDARDLVQTTFEIAIRHQATLRDRRRIHGWLIRIETREAFRIRRRWRRALRWFEGNPPADTADPPEQMMMLRDALARLPRRERTAIVLHYMVDLPVSETADAMGVSANTVKSQLKSGLTRLRQAMR